jgi:N-acetylmuramoyl-L-alanine amidase
MKKSALSSILIIGAISLLSYQSRINCASADVRYDSGSIIKNEIYYSQSDNSEPSVVQCSTSNISESVTPMYIVGESKLAGVSLSDFNIENRWNIDLTDEEIALLAKIVWTESRGEEDEGEQAVIEVIFNRMIYKYEFSGTLEDVVSQDGQFCSWSKRNEAEPTKKEYRNIKKVLNGETNILDFDTVYFSTEPRNDDISAHIGKHYFCRYEIQ